MDGKIDYDKVRLITEANMRSIMNVTKDSDWQTEFPQYDSDGNELAPTTNLGLQGLRDAIAQTIVDILTNVTGSGNATTSSDGSNSSPPSKSGDNSKVVLQINGKFAIFYSFEDCFHNFFTILKTTDVKGTQRYKAVLESKNLAELCIEISACGYATDPKYTQKIYKIAKKLKNSNNK